MAEALRVLYVDDEEDIRSIVEMSLELSGEFVVRTCDGGEAALEEAAQWRPDLILLDFMMPGLDGPQTLLKLREQPETAAIPAAFVTARSQPADIAELMAIGAIGVIAKPFDPMTFGDDVTALMESQAAA